MDEYLQNKDERSFKDEHYNTIDKETLQHDRLAS
jgi:hypothetical protein